MKIKVKGKGETSLDKRDFLASGGEGSVYAKRTLAYKIYSDRHKMIPVGKINELADISDPNVIRPLDVIMDMKGQEIGYTMRYIRDTLSLCETFPKVFKDKNGLDPQKVFDLVDGMRMTTNHIHSKGILIVDCNEMNFLINSSLDEVYFIDVDSYQTASFPATALMESVRDRHAKPGYFDENTDWFSWGIVTFQMFMGIHPYKGKHPTLKGFDARMGKNMSVFNSEVSVPKIVPDFNILPPAYLEWYKAVFEDGKRYPPPIDATAVLNVINKIIVVKGSDKIDIQEIGSYGQFGNIVHVYFNYGKRIIQCTDGVFIDHQEYDDIKTDSSISFTETMNHVIASRLDKGRLRLKNLSTGKDIPNQLTADKTMLYDGRLYTILDGTVSELGFMEFPNNIMASPKVVANIMPQSYQVFDGVIVQNILEARDFSIFPEKGRHCLVRVKEIEGMKIVDAKYDRGVLMVVASDNKGVYTRFVLRFTPKHNQYDIRSEEDITPQGLNFTVLDSGVCAHINEDENLVLFRKDKGSSSAKVVQDKAVRSDMRLHRWDAEATVAVRSKLYRIKTK